MSSLREDSPDEALILKGEWKTIRSADKNRLIRIRQVWINGLTDVAGIETRIDVQFSDKFTEFTSLSAAFLAYEKAVPANSIPEGFPKASAGHAALVNTES